MSTEDTASSEHGADAETSQVPPPPRDESGLAWSVDDDTDEVPAIWRGRLIWAGLSVLLVAIAAALVLLVSTLLGRHSTNDARPQPVPSPRETTTVAVAPPTAQVAPPSAGIAPPRATVTVTPPTAALEGVDARFISFLRNNDPDSFFTRIYNATAIADAHLVCKDFLNGASTQNAADRMPGISRQDFARFIDAASANYCPQYGGNI